eukprot:GFUD01071375.1.p1 GENE.GFUD01071375.1~~GFUD01071375.1.p1  ORF type:complete len:104 (-),score=18.30 GFUD01071375.1:113-424(-)
MNVKQEQEICLRSTMEMPEDPKIINIRYANTELVTTFQNQILKPKCLLERFGVWYRWGPFGPATSVATYSLGTCNRYERPARIGHSDNSFYIAEREEETPQET